MLLLLRSLDPRFVRCDIGTADELHGKPLDDCGEIEWGGFDIDILSRVETLTEADGISFLCPGCYMLNCGPIGTHRVQVFFLGKGAPDHIGEGSDGKPQRWNVIGNDFLDLSIAPSIHVKTGCGWHGFIEHGTVRNVR